MKKKNLLKIEVYLGKSGPEVIARSPSGLQSSLSSVDGAAQIWHPTHPCG